MIYPMQSIGAGLYFLLMILRKCFGHIKSPDDEQSLQNDLYNLAFWSAIHLMYFSIPPKVPMYRLIKNF